MFIPSYRSLPPLLFLLASCTLHPLQPPQLFLQPLNLIVLLLLQLQALEFEPRPVQQLVCEDGAEEDFEDRGAERGVEGAL